MNLKNRIDKKMVPARLVSALKKNSNVHLGISRDWNPLPTGVAPLDNHVIGIGGLPRGAIVEIAGPSGSAKSALLYTIMANVQELGGSVALLQPEDAYDSEWGRRIGVVEGEVITGDFDTTEEAMRLVVQFIQANVDFIAIDSLARLVPEKDFEQTLSNKEKKPAEQARVLRSWLGIILNGYRKRGIPKLRDTNTCLVMINHTTSSISAYGKQYVTTGGTAVEYDPHLRLSTWHRGWSSETDLHGRPLRQLIRIKQEKSRLQWGPKASCEVWLTAGGKFEEKDDVDFLLNLAIDRKLVERRGGWIYILDNSNLKFQGKEKFKDYCDDNLEFKKLILLSNIGGGRAGNNNNSNIFKSNG